MPKRVMESNRPQIYSLMDQGLYQLTEPNFLTKGRVVFLFLLMSQSLDMVFLFLLTLYSLYIINTDFLFFSIPWKFMVEQRGFSNLSNLASPLSFGKVD